MQQHPRFIRLQHILPYLTALQRMITVSLFLLQLSLHSYINILVAVRQAMVPQLH